MNHNDETIRHARRQRELLLLRYADALAAGDMDSVGAILEQAAQDPELEQGIWETHLALGEEIRQEEERAIAARLAQDASTVQELAKAHFSASVYTGVETGAIEESEEEIRPVTVGEVAADLRGRAQANPAILNLLHKLERSEEPIAPDVSVRGIRTLLSRLGIDNAGRQLIGMFQDAVFALSMQRQGHAFRLAATRRQRSVTSRPDNTGKSQRSDEPANDRPDGEEHQS